MPNKNRNKNRHFNRNNQNRNFQNGGGGGGSQNSGRHGVHDMGIQKRRDGGGGGGGGRHHGGSNRRIYLNPTVIESLEDNFESEAPHSSNYRPPRRDDRGKKNRAIERLKEMGTEKTKLSIGDTEQDVKKTLIPSKPHCQLSVVPDDVFALIVTYVQKYFTCFDSNRESLLEAYNSKCIFSFSLNMSNPDTYRQFRFDDYLVKENRNLKRIQGLDEHQHDRRFRLLRQGRIDTVGFLTKMPATEHEPTSFKLDCTFYSPKMIAFTLTGVFREGKPTDKVRPLRSFHRIFVCVPDPQIQMSIVNEEFIMSNLTREQQAKYFVNPDQQASKSEPARTSAAADVAPLTTGEHYQAMAAAAPAVLQPNLENFTPEQVQMIQQFSLESRLNLEWSKHCLDHAQWNYQEAGKQFLEHKDKIPMEAFLS